MSPSADLLKWIDSALDDEHAWKFALDTAKKQYLAGLSAEDTDLVVSRIIDRMNSSPEYWQFVTCAKLIEDGLGPKAAATVPLLRRHASNQSVAWRRAAIRALGGIGPAATSALPSLTDSVGDPDDSVRKAAQEAIEQIRAVGRTELPPSDLANARRHVSTASPDGTGAKKPWWRLW